MQNIRIDYDLFLSFMILFLTSHTHTHIYIYIYICVQPIACKPLFFDLANNHVMYPSLADRTQSMLGLIKGFFGKK